MTSCPTPEQVEDLLANRLGTAEAEALRFHLAGCPSCQARQSTSALSAQISPYPFLAPPRAAGELGWLDGHRVLAVLGEGGMSIVFDAEDTQLGRRVALKVLRPRMTDPTTRERFLREAKLIAALPHEHIVTVYRVGESNGVSYLTMERLEGTSLEERLKRDRWLPLDEAISLTREAAEGLVVAHEADLVHRDIKPANLWLETRQGRFRRVKLIDFGIARMVNQDSSLTSTGQVLGTPMYMAPEQAAGGSVDGRTDLYSLGGVLYHMLTGRAPFDGREPTTMALLAAVIAGDTPKVKLVAPQLPPAVAELIQDLLAREPAERPANARVLVERLRNLETNASMISSPSPQSLAASPAQGMIRRPGLIGIWVGILAVTAALIVSGISLWEKFGPYHEPRDDPGVSGGGGGPPLKIGILHSLTETLSLHERPVARATRFAVEEINKAGGVMGRKIEAIEEDGESDETVFAARARKLIEEDGVAVLFGCWTSSARKRVDEVCRKHDRLLFFPTITEGLEESPNVIYLGGVPNQTLIPLIRWAYADKHKRNFFLIGSEAVFSHAVNAILEHEITRLGGKIAGARYFPYGENNLGNVISEITESKADMIINTIDGQGNQSLLRGLRGVGITPAKVPTVWVNISESELSSFRVSEMLGDFSVSCYFESLPAASNQAFVDRFRERYGVGERVNDAMQTAYFGVHLWKAAVEKAGKTESHAVRRVLPGLTVEAPEGPITLDPKNLHAYRTARIGEIIEGKSRSQFKVVFHSPEPLRPQPFPEWRTQAEWKKFLNVLYVKWGEKWEKHR